MKRPRRTTDKYSVRKKYDRLFARLGRADAVLMRHSIRTADRISAIKAKAASRTHDLDKKSDQVFRELVKFTELHADKLGPRRGRKTFELGYLAYRRTQVLEVTNKAVAVAKLEAAGHGDKIRKDVNVSAVKQNKVVATTTDGLRMLKRHLLVFKVHHRKESHQHVLSEDVMTPEEGNLFDH